MAFDKPELLKKLNNLGFPEYEIILTFEEFFIGNECEESIGVNLYPNKPPVAEFYQTFKKLLDENIADAIFIRIVDIEDPEEWIFSDTVYVIGNLTIKQLEEGIKNLIPDEINEGWIYGEPVNIGQYNKTKNIFTIFWD
jgi:hypothetical protein